MWQWIDSVPLRGKLGLASMVPCAVGLLCATGLFVERQRASMEGQAKQEIRVLAEVIADSSSAAVAFGDVGTAREILGSLAAQKGVRSAQLLTLEGDVFAEYLSATVDIGWHAQEVSPEMLRDGGLVSDGQEIVVVEPVHQMEHRLGTLVVVESLARLRAQQQRLLTLGAIVFLGSLGVAFVLSNAIQKRISTPILNLAATTRKVREQDDYSIRAEGAGSDEIGFLVASFNAMLERISSRELALEESRERFEFAVRGTSEGLWEWDVEAGSFWASDQFRTLIGLEPGAELQISGGLDAHVHPEDHEALRKTFEAHAQDHAPFDLEIRVRATSAQWCWFRVRATSVRSAAGQPIRMAGSIQDVAERKQAEQEREHLLRALESKNQELEQIVYVTSHDLRSPLVNIQGFSSELRFACTELEERMRVLKPKRDDVLERLLTEDIPEILGFIERSGKKMETLLAGLLKLSRSGRKALDLRHLDMENLIRQVLSDFEFVAQERDLSISVGDLPDCYGDETQLNQVFSNLISNAIKYLESSRPGEIHVSGEAAADRSIYCVRDNGIGIPAAHQGRIFDVFHRLHPDRSEGEGLGLNIVRKSLDRLSGRVWLESEPGRGSRFYISMPSTPNQWGSSHG
jgi:PAS domain S-box-containing protein